MKKLMNDSTYAYLKACLILAPFTSLIYLYTNWRTDQVMRSFAVYFDFELKIPFMQSFIYPYLSLTLFLLSPCFFLVKKEISLLQKRLFIGVLVGLAFYYIFPSPLAFLRPHETQGAFGWLYEIDRPNNASFSMYHFYLSLIAMTLFSKLKTINRLGLVLYVMVLAISGLLIWQQHLMGIMSSWVTAFILFFAIKESDDPVGILMGPKQ